MIEIVITITIGVMDEIESMVMAMVTGAGNVIATIIIEIVIVNTVMDIVTGTGTTTMDTDGMITTD